MSKKKYFWLKLKSDFFKQREIKKLRMVAGGDTYTIIYLKMQLLSLVEGGYILFAETEQDIYEQISLEIDEKLDDVKLTITFLMNNNLAIIDDKQDLALVETKELIGSETDSAKRVRMHRKRQKELQGNTRVTKSNTDIEIDIDKELDIESDIELDEEEDTNNSVGNSISFQVEKLRIILKKYYGNSISSKFGTTNVEKRLKSKLKTYDFDYILNGFENYLVTMNNEKRELTYIKSVEAFLNQDTFIDYQTVEKTFKENDSRIQENIDMLNSIDMED